MASDDLSGDSANVEELLLELERGADGALDRLVTSIYPALKQLARSQIARERPGHTLSTTAIVHEAYIRMSASEGKWTDRAHLMRAAARIMRHLLVDHARKHNAAKRSFGHIKITFNDQLPSAADSDLAVLALENAMTEIAAVDPRLAAVIECRYFAGYSVEDTAETLGLPMRTVERLLQRARALISAAICSD